MMSFVGKLPEYPHPIASKISSRMMVELGVLTAAMAAAAVVVGGFFASAVFAVTRFVFATAVYVIWPVIRPFIKLFHLWNFGTGLGKSCRFLGQWSNYVKIACN